MGMKLGIRTETFDPVENHEWLGSAHGTDICDSITLDGDAFLTLFPTGVIPSGVVLGRVTASGKYVPYGGTTDEVQTVTEGGSGLTSFTLTYAGQTTGAIAAGATAAQVQTALEALSNIDPGDVVVTGGAGGPFTVTFAGNLADTNVAQMTATPTGGTGTVTVATLTAGGSDAVSDGSEVARGHLFTTVDLGGTTAPTVGDVPAALFWHGEVVTAKLPTGHGLDANAQTDLKHIRYV